MYLAPGSLRIILGVGQCDFSVIPACSSSSGNISGFGGRLGSVSFVVCTVCFSFGLRNSHSTIGGYGLDVHSSIVWAVMALNHIDQSVHWWLL